MEIFKSKIYQENGIINATQLYIDIDEFISKQKERLALERGINPDDVRLHRHHDLQHILNSTSGNYVSPTAMKSFMACPGGYLYNKLVPEKTGVATSVGRTFHTIMERFYNETPDNRNQKKIYEIMETVIKEDQQYEKANDVKIYVDGYLDSFDYLTQRPMDHENLICSNEVFIKPIINPLGVNLGVPVYVLIDRIDIRDDGIYVIDYKTGFGDPNPYLLGFNGYLPQMIFYKWAVEAEYGESVKGVYLALPGASQEYKYTEMNVNSLVEQSKVVEQVKEYIDHARAVRESKQFPTSLMRYCNSCQFKSYCSTYIKSKGLDESQILSKIPVEIEIKDEYGE